MVKRKEREGNFYDHQTNTNYYNPQNIFHSNTLPSGLKTLLKPFTETRYRYNTDINDNSTIDNIEENFNRNAGAVSISKPNISPIISSNLSHPIFSNKGTQTTLGHSEKLAMRDALDKLITNNNHEIERPSFYTNGERLEINREREVLKHLVQNANQYNRYLLNNDYTVDVWTERPPCNSETDNCSTFLRTILPENSNIGYIAKNPTTFTTNNDHIKSASNVLRNSYKDYMDANKIIDYYKQDPPSNQFDHFFLPWDQNDLNNLNNFETREDEKKEGFRTGGHVMKFKPRNGLSRYPRKSLANFIKTGRV